jgi:hypothetical protein
VKPTTLGADATAQARTLVTRCREKQQRVALVAALRDFEDELLGTAEEAEAWEQWARTQDKV